MNYLAHAYLSFGNNEILLGNMISDFIKGKKQFEYPLVVQKGILLHRAIDNFTDTHPITKKAKEVFRKEYRLYSGAFIDVAFDHFLANNKNEFSKNELFDFSQKTYKALAAQENLMPKNYKRMFFYMRAQNWLYEYRTLQGINRSFGGLVKRAAYLHNSTPAEEIFKLHYDFLKDCFDVFWKELKPFAANMFNELLQSDKM